MSNSKIMGSFFFECLEYHGNPILPLADGLFPTKLYNYCVGGNYISNFKIL